MKCFDATYLLPHLHTTVMIFVRPDKSAEADIVMGHLSIRNLGYTNQPGLVWIDDNDKEIPVDRVMGWLYANDLNKEKEGIIE